MPRPKLSEEEKQVKFTLRLDKDLMSELESFCERNNLKKAKALKMAISLYIGYVPKKNKNKKD